MIRFKIHWLHVPALSNKSATSSSKSNLKFEEDDCYCYCNDDIEDEDEEDDDRMIAVVTARMMARDQRNSNLNRNRNRRNCSNFREHSKYLSWKSVRDGMGSEASLCVCLRRPRAWTWTVPILALARGLDMSIYSKILPAAASTMRIMNDVVEVLFCSVLFCSVLFCSRRGTTIPPVADHEKVRSRADPSTSPVFAG